jgi:hypothetical protein
MENFDAIINPFITKARQRVKPITNSSDLRASILDGKSFDINGKSDKIREIIEEEHRNLIDYVNVNYVEYWSEDTLKEFELKKLEDFKTLFQETTRDLLGV